MADLKPIEHPTHLNEHNIPQQELARMTPSEQALAKDWNILNRKMDWVVDRVVEIRNLQVEHDTVLDKVKKILWLSGFSVTTIIVLWQVFRFIVGDLMRK